MRHLRSRASFAAILSAAAMLATSAVNAAIIPVFNVATPTGNGCEFSYTVSVASGAKVNPGDYFTIYDFNGYVDGSAFAPADWDIAENFVGDTPASQIVVDDPGVINLTFIYTGTTALVGPVNPVGGTGAFGAESIFCTTKVKGQYAGESHKNNPGEPDHNSLQGNQGFLVTPSAIPESSSLMLLVPGLVPLGIMLRRRARKE